MDGPFRLVTPSGRSLFQAGLDTTGASLIYRLGPVRRSRVGAPPAGTAADGHLARRLGSDGVENFALCEIVLVIRDV